MAEFTVMVPQKKTVRFLRAECGVRYWEDAKINGVEDTEDGSLIPCRNGDVWAPLIDIDAGRIVDWPEGVEADIHYKVCDDGCYRLLGEDQEEVATKYGYVISMMCPEGGGFGDYVVMKVSGDGAISNWSVDLSDFEEDDY